MATNIKEIIKNTKDIFMTDSALVSLLEFERVIDQLDVYVFKNWKQGELAKGPVYEKYFITCTFMWPYKKMPDPSGGQRLLDYGCEVRYKKAILKYPVKVKTPNDFEPGTKMPKMAKTPIWFVEISMPRQLMSEIHRGSIEIESELYDADEIASAYEQGANNDVYDERKDQNEQAQ